MSARIVRVWVAAAAFSLAVGVGGRVGVEAGQAAGNAATGRTVVLKAGCAQCHGDDGRGTAAAPPIVGTILPLPTFIARVRTPTGNMPALSVQSVSDQDLAHVYAFLRSGAPAAGGLQAGAGAGAPAGRADVGAMLFRKVACFTCHVNEAQGGANGPRLGPDPIPFARFLAYVRNPAGDMPPYTSKVMSDQDLADVYAFLQTRAKPPAVNTIPLLAR